MKAALCALGLLLPTMLPGCADPSPDPPVAGPPTTLRLERVAAGLSQPVFATQPYPGAPLFIVEQEGLIRTWQDGALSTFLDLSEQVRAGGERGLLGLALHPGFRDNGLLVVDYTDLAGDTVVASYQRGADGRADPASARVLLQVDQPYANHNGGMVAFGPDGHLYVGMGDGGSAGDPHGHAQDLGSLLGKLLRVDVGVGPHAPAYAVPGDNPFVGRAGARPEVWAYGLRNPWRFSFDRETGDLWIGDVGQGDWEEIDLQAAASRGGENHGWNAYEGSHPYNEEIAAPGATMPVWEYRNGGGDCAVTGGHVYRGAAIPALRGTYLYGDYCSGKLWGLRRDGGAGGAWSNRLLLETGLRISSFGEDAAGELLVVDHGGAVHRLVAGP